MFAAILWICAVLAIVGAFAYGIYQSWDYWSSVWSWAIDSFQAIRDLVPDWLLPIVAALLVVSTVSLIVKLL